MMSRPTRRKSEAGMYHVMLRGINGQKIFNDEDDNLRFLLTLRRVKATSGFDLFAYCLMGNHVHLLIREVDEPLPQVFRRLGTSYAQYFNLKYDRHGHLFQDRYRSETVEDDPYFLDVLRYICQNPVKAGLVKNPFEYPWLGISGISGDSLLDSLKNLTDLAGEELLKFVVTPCERDHLEYSEGKRISDREAVLRIREACGCVSPAEIADWEANRRDEAVRRAIKQSVSIRQFERLTKISKAYIEKALR